MGRFREDHPHHGVGLVQSTEGLNRTRTWRKGGFACSARHGKSILSCPWTSVLGPSDLGWTYPHPPAFWGLLLVVCRLWDFSAPSRVSQFHLISPPSCLSMHVLLVHFSSLKERLGQVDVYAPVHLEGLGTSIPACVGSSVQPCLLGSRPPGWDRR